MFEQANELEGDCESKILKDISNISREATNDIINENEEKINNQVNFENEFLLEQSFEVISPPSSIPELSNMETNEAGGAINKGTDQQTNDVDSNKFRSNSESHSDSSQNQPKKSASFLSRLQSSVDERGGSTNIPTSFASAFSSFSSFTSNFNLNPNSNNNNNNNNIASSLTIETASTSTKFSLNSETKDDIFRKKASLERKNLISLTKLIVKDLISSSLVVSRTIDDCHSTIHLNNYFTLIDRVLKHGLKQNLLSNRSASLWNALDSLPKYLKESTLMSESVRSLANTKTPDGKIKAWMRLAMMQKKLPEYFNELLASKDALLKDIYHDYAFMLNDEAHVFAGLIIGVNVIDCNFFVKDANFDLMDDIIDLGPYLRLANSYDNEEEEDSKDGFHDINEHKNEHFIDKDKITAVLDQKNYLEEWNKRLESTIFDLQSKIKSLEEQNSKLEMEAKLSEAKILKLQGKRSDTPSEQYKSNSTTITDAIKNFIGNPETVIDVIKHQETTEQAHQKVETKQDSIESSSNLKSNDIEEIQSNLSHHPTDSAKPVKDDLVVVANRDLELKLADQEKELVNLRERASILEGSYRAALEKIKTLERDLDVQTSMNTDKETTIKIYEKDIKDKQALVESLRNSLNDAKKLYSDVNDRLNDSNIKMKDRIKAISHLQDSLVKWKFENKNLATRLHDTQTALKSVTSDLEKATKTIEDLKKYNERINEELKRERESGQSSSVTLETQNAKITELTNKLSIIESELKDAKPFKNQNEELAKRCKDYEQSLEEIGSQLRESRLEVENLKENSAVFLDSQWIDSKQAKTCALCQQSFSVTRRKHHCRLCGNVFCQTCSDNKMELASSAKPVRVCDTCHAFLLAKFVKSSSSS